MSKYASAQALIFVQGFALFPLLLMSSSVKQAALASILFAVVMGLSHGLFLLRKSPYQLLYIALYLSLIVSAISLFLQTFMPSIAWQLGVFVPLLAASDIVVLQVLKPEENFALQCKRSLKLIAWVSLLMLLMGVLRELLATGALFAGILSEQGLRVFSGDFALLLIGTAPGALIVMALLVALWNRYQAKHKKNVEIDSDACMQRRVRIDVKVN